MDEEKGFFAELFDLSFSTFVTMKIIKLIFIIAIAASGIMALSIIGAGFSQSFGAGIGSLILGPLVFLVYVLGARVWLELIIVVFRIEKNTSHLIKGGDQEEV